VMLPVGTRSSARVRGHGIVAEPGHVLAACRCRLDRGWHVVDTHGLPSPPHQFGATAAAQVERTAEGRERWVSSRSSTTAILGTAAVAWRSQGVIPNRCMRA
jgi:hypothetical protein